MGWGYVFTGHLGEIRPEGLEPTKVLSSSEEKGAIRRVQESIQELVSRLCLPIPLYLLPS